jgi:hypothetical protein
MRRDGLVAARPRPGGAATTGAWRRRSISGAPGETARGAEVDSGFDTLIKNLNMAFMGAFEARRSKWSAGVDLVYLNVGAKDNSWFALLTRVVLTR